MSDDAKIGEVVDLTAVPAPAPVGRFVKLPVEISAVQWDGSPEGATVVVDWVLAGGGAARYHAEQPAYDDWQVGTAGHPAYILIDTPDATGVVLSGDWAIRGPAGDHYPCKPDIFDATYRPAGDPSEEFSEVHPAVIAAFRRGWEDGHTAGLRDAGAVGGDIRAFRPSPIGHTQHEVTIGERSVLAVNRLDAEGRPAGGWATGTGLSIEWQDGPLFDPNTGERGVPNGAFVEDVIEVAAERIRFYQGTQFACPENAMALSKLGGALSQLRARTARRTAQGVEGTHQGS